MKDQHVENAVIDIEAYAKEDKPVPPGKQYQFKVDKDKFTVDHHIVTGHEILTISGRLPVEQYRLDLKMKGGRTQQVNLDDRVDLTEPGLEKFLSLKLDQTEGGSMRRHFDLSEEDVEHLDARGLPWETVNEAGQLLLLIHDFPIPNGYNHELATIALMIPSQYPIDQLDMVWFYPELKRNDNVPIGALCPQTIDGQSYQRWSRHRTAEAPWRPEVDSIATHLSLVEEWLKREFQKVG